MGTDLSKCGQRGYDSRGCKLENFKECSDLRGSEFLGLGVRRGRVQVADESKRQGNPTLQQIKKLNWSNFKMYEGLCYKRLTDKPRSKVSWSLYRHSAAIPAQVPVESGTDTAGDGEKGLFAEIFDPIERGFDLVMKGKFDKALEEVGIERVAGLAVTGLLGIVILVSLARLPFKVARKNKERRIETERQNVARGKREAAARAERERQAELERHSRIAVDAQRRAAEAEQRAAQAEGAVHEALRVAQEIAATREPTPLPQSIPTEATPLPLVQGVKSEREYSAGRVDDATDPQIDMMAKANVDFAIIDTVLRIAEGEGRPLLEIERETEKVIRMAEVKRAAAIAWHHPIEGKTHLETTTQLLAIGAGVFESKESLGDPALKRAAKYLSQNQLAGETVDKSLMPYRDWLKSNEYETEAFKDHRRMMSARSTVVPGGGEVTPNVGTVTAEPITRHVDLNADGTPAARGKAGTELTGLPQRAQSVTTDVIPERLAEEVAVDKARRGAAAPEFMFVKDGFRNDPNETRFSPAERAQLDGAVQFATGGDLPLTGAVDDRHHDPSSVMREARFILDKESKRFGNPNDKMKIEIANRFSDAVKQVPGFAKTYYGGGKGREIDREGLKVVADLVRFMKEDARYSGLGSEGITIEARRYLTGFLASEEVQGRYFELKGKVDLVGMTRAKEVVEGGARPKRGGARPAGRTDERRKERKGSDRYIDPFAEDSELKRLAKDVGKKYGK